MTIFKKKKNLNNNVKNDEGYRELDDLIQNGSEIEERTSIFRKILNFLTLASHEIRDNIYVYLLCVLYLSVCVMNKILAKRTLNKIGNYSFVTSETHNCICMIVFSALYFIVSRYKKSSKEGQRNFGLQFLFISLLDACSVIIAFIGLTRTTGNIQSFVLQLSIPINMFFCFLILQYRYHLFNYLGAFIIVVTIAIVEMILSFETQEENSIIFNLVLISSLIPLSFSNMTREIVFKKYKIDILRLNAVVSFFQIFTSCLILPVYTLPFLKQIHIPFSEIGTNIKNGFNCLFLGKNTIVENCGIGMARMCDDCNGAWVIRIQKGNCVKIGEDMLAHYIIEKFSTMTYTIVSCIQGPAIAIAYYFKFLAGDVVREPRILDFVTLFGYLFGSIIYRVGNVILEKKKKNSGNDEDSEADITNVDSIITA